MPPVGPEKNFTEKILNYLHGKQLWPQLTKRQHYKGNNQNSESTWLLSHKLSASPLYSSLSSDSVCCAIFLGIFTCYYIKAMNKGVVFFAQYLITNLDS